MLKGGRDAESMRAKISGYEDYKAGKMTRETFLERKKAMDARKQELSAAVSEMETQEIVDEAGKREYREAFRIQEYLHLESYDKRVMTSLIASAKVMDEDRLEYGKWYCGHYHTEKKVDIVEIMFENFGVFYGNRSE